MPGNPTAGPVVISRTDTAASQPRHRRLLQVLCLAGSAIALPALAQSSFNGSAGYINTPSAQMREDGTLVTGLSHASPYTALYVGLQALPWLELIGRYQQSTGVPGFKAGPGIDYGSFKDKSVGVKLRLWPENALGLRYLPALAIGVDDIGIGTEAFATAYTVASKRLHWGASSFDTSLGYGQRRMQGVFAGLRYQHADWPRWALLADYDRINFRQDVGAAQIGLDRRRIGQFNLALEYTSPAGWSLQLGQRDGQPALNVGLTVPFGRTSLRSKTAEPAPYVDFGQRMSTAQWIANTAHLQGIAQRLHEDGLRQLHLSHEDGVLRARLSSNRYLDPHRAVGRALRILLSGGPQDLRSIEVTYLHDGLPTLHYHASDLEQLALYFSGGASDAQLLPSLKITTANSDQDRPDTASPNLLPPPLPTPEPAQDSDGMATGLPLDARIGGETPGGHRWSIGPAVQVLFNDPSGALKAALDVRAEARYQIRADLALDAAVNYRLLENISDVQQRSNSRLPHVRSDIAEYFRHQRYTVDKLVLNHFARPAPQWYTRVSAGLYETMFAGVGAQALLVPERARWTLDLNLDYLGQRSATAPLKLTDYRVWSGLLSAHVELPYQLTGTVRLGRFLAGDEGSRFELKREFPSGVQMGLWYSHTNGRDTTSPGTVANPYRDKGVFMRIPFDTVAPRYSKRLLHVQLSPWSRDVGQMVQSPGDLRQLLEQGTLRPLQNPLRLGGFGGVDAEESP